MNVIKYLISITQLSFNGIEFFLSIFQFDCTFYICYYSRDTLCLLPVLLLLRRADASQTERQPPLLRPLLNAAFRDRSYLLLSLAFFTCGFHMAIIETHLYTQFTAYGFSEQHVTYTFSLYGIAAMPAALFPAIWAAACP